MLVLMKNPVSTRDKYSSDCVSWLGKVSNTVSKNKDISCCKCNSAKMVSLFSTLRQQLQSPDWWLSSGKGNSPYLFTSVFLTPARASLGPALAWFMMDVSCTYHMRTTNRTWCPSHWEVCSAGNLLVWSSIRHHVIPPCPTAGWPNSDSTQTWTLTMENVFHIESVLSFSLVSQFPS